MIDQPNIRYLLIGVAAILAFIFIWGVNAQFTRDARLISIWRTVRKAGEALFSRGDPAG